MRTPGTPGTGISGAHQRISLDSRTASRLPHARPTWQRLQRDPRLQRALEHLHRCGPRAVGEFITELLDAHDVPPAALDRALAWRRLDPALVVALGADRF